MRPGNQGREHHTQGLADCGIRCCEGSALERRLRTVFGLEHQGLCIGTPPENFDNRQAEVEACGDPCPGDDIAINDHALVRRRRAEMI